MGHREEQDAARARKKQEREARDAEQDKKMKDGAWRMKWKRAVLPYQDLQDILVGQGLVQDGHRVLYWSAGPDGLHITTAPDE